MKTDGFSMSYPYPKLDDIGTSTTSFDGKGNAVSQVIVLRFSNKDHKNVHISLERKEAERVIKEMQRHLKPKSVKRHVAIQPKY